MQVYDQTDIKQFNLSNDKPFVVTESGCIIHCKKVIFCSGFETTKLVKEKVAKLFYTYACVSVQNPRVLTPCHHDDLNVKMNWEWGSALPVFPSITCSNFISRSLCINEIRMSPFSLTCSQGRYL